jgi:hypothetical protein
MLGSGVLPLTLGQRVVVLRYRRLPWAPGVASSPRLGFLPLQSIRPGALLPQRA